MSIKSAINVGYKFLGLARQDNVPVSPMKLQKLVYIAHGWSLGLLGAPLISNNIYAWKFGPVIEELYHHFKRHGAQSIVEGDNKISAYVEELAAEAGEEELIKAVWDVYKDVSGLKLSDLTHQDGTPWDSIWNKQGGKGLHGALISDDVIAGYYRDFLAA